MTDASNNALETKGVLGWICGGLARACLVIAGAALLGIVAINGVNVVARYFFGSPFSWAEELMLFLMILAVFSGTIAVTWYNQHIRIEMVVDRLPPRFRGVVRVLAAVASIAIIIVVVTASYRLVSLLQSLEQRSDALNAPSWIPQSFVTIGLALSALMIAARLAISSAGDRSNG